MRVSGFILGCSFRNQFSQRYLFKNIYAQNLQSLGQAKFQPKFLAQDRHQHVNADGDPDLRLDRVVAGAEKVFDPQVLFDPLEEQLHPPAALVELGDGQCGQVEVIGQKDQRLAGVGVAITNPPESLGVMFDAFGKFQPDDLVAVDTRKGVSPGKQAGWGNGSQDDN